MGLCEVSKEKRTEFYLGLVIVSLCGSSHWYGSRETVDAVAARIAAAEKANAAT
jgi:hypothetical protein